MDALTALDAAASACAGAIGSGGRRAGAYDVSARAGRQTAMGCFESDCVVRPYRRGDRAAVRRICAATAWLGEPGPRLVGDEWIWAEYWTRYFTDRQWRTCWVATGRRDGPPVGYLTSTPDVARFEGYLPFLLPGIVARVVGRRLISRRQPRRAILNLLGSLRRGELDLPPGVARDYPATFHFNLLPEARRQGLGSRMLRTFLDRMRALGVAGVHAQPMGLNRASAAAIERAGFRLVAETPLRAFTHHDPRPMTVQTWVVSLTDARKNP